MALILRIFDSQHVVILKYHLMKTMTRILLFLSVTFMVSCQGDRGPIGPPGEDGQDGYNILGTVFEIQGTFNSSNDYLLYYEFPSSFTVYDGDVVMVYILWEQDNGLDVWRALPQTRFLNDGVLQYNFDYTLADVQIYIDGTIDPTLLTSADTDNQIFRIAVIPADLATNKLLDITDYDAVMKALNRTSDSVKTIHISQ